MELDFTEPRFPDDAEIDDDYYPDGEEEYPRQ
jgi:hypothetical protein